jgi:ketosteroid isomerase-like protein
MSQEKFETVRRLIASLNARDVDGYIACCTEDVEVVTATAPIDGAYRDRSGIERFFADLRDTAPDFEMRIERLEAVGEKVLATERGSASGRTSEVHGDLAFSTVYEFRDRKISRIQVFLDAGKALEAVGLRG